ncbi:MAG: YggS family pyridoxal phosphate-dependent enzyme [Sphingopyxis sp.]
MTPDATPAAPPVPPAADAPPDGPAALLAAVHQGIARAAADARLPLADVTLIAVSKTHDAAAITPLIAAGQRHFGENRVQEAQGKWPALRAAHPGTTLHLIGQLQSNKADEAVALFDCIHSVDRPSLITALARAMDKMDRRLPCFVQVNLAGEEQKGGCAPAQLPALLAMAQSADLPIMGLMTVPPAALEPAPWFALLAKIADDYGLAGRSMGMSGDYGSAIRLGATHIRVGSALFGARD